MGNSVAVGQLPGCVKRGPGRPSPKGCSEAAGGGAVNFTLDAPGSKSAWLLALLPPGHPGLAAVGAAGSTQDVELHVLLDPAQNRSGDTWHIELEPSFEAKGVKYAWLLDPPLGPEGRPQGHAKRLLDPCAKCMSAPHAPDQWNRRAAKYSPLGMVPDHRVCGAFNWDGVKPPGHHMKDLVIYEAHVRGFTRNRDSGISNWEQQAGSYLGFVEKIPYLMKLGVTAVELLPVFEFDETACPRKNPQNGEQLCNYWGYSTVNFFCPMQRFSAEDKPGAAIVGFKTLVRELHRQGIEVLLDVVFNHTAEGCWGEHNWHSLESIARDKYYIIKDGKHCNYTGCGNTVNANDGLAAEWILECMRFWVEEMHVDGFRFDLASTLCRDGNGRVGTDPHVIKMMVQDPVLSKTKLIAEPWDCSWPDGYLVGKFPQCGPSRWAEWNGIFRDTVRSFLKGDESQKGDFCTRLCGSADLYKGRAPYYSINFVTAHDGFTLRDLVSYNGKHNECNGENSGDDHNRSWNCGAEGETGDGGVKHARERQTRNFLVALLLSVGTPMITFGDEVGRTQRGCNNGWCQDALSWFSWSDYAREENKLFRFVRLLIAFRKAHHRVFARESFVGDKDIWWRHHWDDPYNYVCYVLHDRQDGYNGILIAFNAGAEKRVCDLPPGNTWYRVIDTNLPAPTDIADGEEAAVQISGSYGMMPHSCVVLTTSKDMGIEQAGTDQYAEEQDVSQHLQKIINRRMSQEFTGGAPQPAAAAALAARPASFSALMQRNASRSGCLFETFDAAGNIQYAMERPPSKTEIEYAPPAAASGPAAPKAEAGFAPPSRPPSVPSVRAPEPGAGLPPACEPPAMEGPSKTGLAVSLPSKNRSVEVLVHGGADSATKTVEVVVAGFGNEAAICHWGAIEEFGGAWKPGPASLLPCHVPAAQAVPGAVQSKFPAAGADGSRRVYLVFKDGYSPKAVEFVIHVPTTNEWIKNGNIDFKVDMPKKGVDFDAAVSRAQEGTQGTTRVSQWTTNGFTLAIVAATGASGASVRALTDAEDSVMLHYGLADADKKWSNGKSVDFAPAQEEGIKEVCISLSPDQVSEYLMFVLKLGANHWVKDGARDFAFEMPQDEKIVEVKKELERQKSIRVEEAMKKIEQEASEFQGALAKFREGRKTRKEAAAQSFESFELSEGAGEVDIGCIPTEHGYQVDVSFCLDPKVAPAASTVLHWGTIQNIRRKEWSCPREDMLPAGTKLVDTKACQSPLDILDTGVYGIRFSMGKTEDEHGSGPEIAAMGFVVHTKDGNKWFKCKDGKDCMAIFREVAGQGGWKGARADVAQKIVESETEWGHMTLMHRYGLCAQLAGEWQGALSGAKRELRRAPSWTAIFRTAESSRSGGSWSRMPSSSLLEAMDAEGGEHDDDEFWSWIFVWQRFSFMKLVDWQRNYNTKPKELASATDNIADKICAIWKEHPNVRLWCRWTLATLGRGGNRGQEIRDEILHIMHRNKIPESGGHFYEQWHQKLHNNTTPDDVGICKALLAFLRDGGKMDTYWRVLADHGITKQRLASYERKITFEPYVHGNNGQVIMEFENYLKILQSVHDALDLQTSIDASRWCLPGDLQQKLDGIMGMGLPRGRSRSMSNLNEGALDGSHGRFMRVADARSSLLAILNDKRTAVGAIRQLLLLDYSLETQQSVLIQGMGGETRLPNLVDQMKCLMMAIVGHMPLHEEIRVVLVDWMQFAPDCASLRYNSSPVESALLLKSMTDRLMRVVGEQVDMFQNLIGPKAMHLGNAVNAPKEILNIFVDEVLRGSALFSVSLVLKRLEPQLRAIAHLPPWQLISAVDRPIQGELKVIGKMIGMEHLIFETPTIFLSGMVSGEEEVPVGVQAVLVRDAASAPDILSHCAVRARNSGVLLATCFDPDITARIESELANQWVELRCKADGSLSIERAERPSTDKKLMRKLSRTNIDFAQDEMHGAGETKLVNMNLKDDLHCSWVVTPGEMDGRKVGSKSLNLALLAPKLPKDVYTPQAVAMPYGCMQKTLTHAENAKEGLAKLEACLRKLQPTTRNEDARVIFVEAQRLTEGLNLPAELAEGLTKAMEAVGDQQGERRLLKLFDKAEAWEATKKVWASLFAVRPWVSLAKAGRSFHDLNMAVLVQELVPAKYAFVLHTKNPFTNDPNEVYGEVVPGRGETLVGNFPGRALSFRAKKGEAPVVSAFLSKSTWLRTQQCLIFRSDSNGEDLEGFAGAGLFESICAKSDIPCMVKFHRLQLIADSAYRNRLLQRLADVGRQVEEAFGGVPQDIEGCVDPDDRIFIVQSRPQV